MILCHKRKSGFTLIELLVVIVIIALLLSIVMPAIREAKKRAQSVICRSNIKHWGLIFSLYAQDNEQSLPQNIEGNGVSRRDADWEAATLPYYGDGKIRICPSTKPDKDVTNIGETNYGSTFEEWGPLGPSTPNTWWDEYPNGSYGINDWCADVPPGLTSYWGAQYLAAYAWRKITDEGGSRIPLLLDCAYPDGFPFDTDVPPSKPDDPGYWGHNAMRLFCMDRHKGGINGVFLDTSARKVGLKELWKLKWHKDYNIDNTYTRPNAPWPEWMRGFTK